MMYRQLLHLQNIMYLVKEEKAMTITVVNVRDAQRGTYVYCGRPSIAYDHAGSPLANPYHLRNANDRPRVLAMYQQWFDSKVQDGDEAVANELARLINLAREGDLNLGCFCAPKLCHCDVIKSFIESHI